MGVLHSIVLLIRSMYEMRLYAPNHQTFEREFLFLYLLHIRPLQKETYQFKNPISFHTWIYFRTTSSLTGPTAASVSECSSVFFVSSTSPPHDMRR